MVHRIQNRGSDSVAGASPLEMVGALCSALHACIARVIKVANDNMAIVRREHNEEHHRLHVKKGVLCHDSISTQKVGTVLSPFTIRV